MVFENGKDISKCKQTSKDSNIIQTHNHLVGKRTLNHLAKLAF